MRKKLCATFAIAGMPVMLHQEAKDRFTVTYWKQVTDGLTYAQATQRTRLLHHARAGLRWTIRQQSKGRPNHDSGGLRKGCYQCPRSFSDSDLRVVCRHARNPRVAFGLYNIEEAIDDNLVLHSTVSLHFKRLRRLAIPACYGVTCETTLLFRHHSAA